MGNKKVREEDIIVKNSFLLSTYLEIGKDKIKQFFSVFHSFRQFENFKILNLKTIYLFFKIKENKRKNSKQNYITKANSKKQYFLFFCSI